MQGRNPEGVAPGDSLGYRSGAASVELRGGRCFERGDPAGRFGAERLGGARNGLFFP